MSLSLSCKKSSYGKPNNPGARNIYWPSDQASGRRLPLSVEEWPWLTFTSWNKCRMCLPHAHFLVSEAEIVWSIDREAQGGRLVCLSAVEYELVGLSGIQCRPSRPSTWWGPQPEETFRSDPEILVALITRFLILGLWSLKFLSMLRYFF